MQERYKATRPHNKETFLQDIAQPVISAREGFGLNYAVAFPAAAAAAAAAAATPADAPAATGLRDDASARISRAIIQWSYAATVPATAALSTTATVSRCCPFPATSMDASDGSSCSL